jgi:hypothetical protein
MLLRWFTDISPEVTVSWRCATVTSKIVLRYFIWIWGRPRRVFCCQPLQETRCRKDIAGASARAHLIGPAVQHSSFPGIRFVAQKE